MTLLESLSRHPTHEFVKPRKQSTGGVVSSQEHNSKFLRRVPAILGVALYLSCFNAGADVPGPSKKLLSHGISRKPISHVGIIDSRSRGSSESAFPLVKSPATWHFFRRLATGVANIDLRRTAWWRIATARALDPYLLYAVALVESARVSDGTAAPWPWAVHRDGKTLYPESPEAAIAQVKASIAERNSMIDVGLMQVNLRWNGGRVEKPEDLINPFTNLRVGADILAEAIASAQGDLALGVGRYHSWRDLDAAYRYGRKVLLIADLIRPSL